MNRYGRGVGKNEFGAPEHLDVDGHEIRLTNPDRPYFPEQGLNKRDVVHYYQTVAEVMLRQIRERPTTLERWPTGVIPGVQLTQRDGTRGKAFFQKRLPKGAPPYVETCRVQFPSGRSADEACPTERAVIVWAATMGTITFHPWPVRRQDPETPDELRLDFDPQPGAGFRDAAKVAMEARALMAAWGWDSFVKTSGGRGLHVYVRIQPRWGFLDTRHAAIAIGRELERRMPGQVTTAWWKEERGDQEVFVDYNQNARDRTIAAAWSVRARPKATVSTPISWESLEHVEPQDFTVQTVPKYLVATGDPWEGIDDFAHDLTPALDLYATDQAERGMADMPYPPDFPKMPDEPKRVQPSRERSD
jgi:DNA ligase D